MTTPAPRTTDRAARYETRFAGPVVLAALASVPATFLTMLEGNLARVGAAVNWLSLAVLTAESLVLLALAADRRAWVRTHRFTLAVAVAAVPAVLLALGPVQVLRIVRAAGALRILRVRRIVRAGRILRQRAGLHGRAARALGTGLSLAAAAFVALVLADPTSTSRQLLGSVLGRFGALPALAAGALLAAATFVLARHGKLRRGQRESASTASATSSGRVLAAARTRRGR